ncbi:hypothetical protein Btaycd_003130 [Bartonella taylorii]|nr:hypothetical protein Btaycd_003130 [Bartonella taylorii]
MFLKEWGAFNWIVEESFGYYLRMCGKMTGYYATHVSDYILFALKYREVQILSYFLVWSCGKLKFPLNKG